MSVCAAAPSPCLPPEKSANFVLKFRLIVETSNSRNVHPVSVTFRRFVYSATCRNDGKAFRRQRFSPFRLHVAIGSAATFFAVSSARCDRIGGSAATFFGASAATFRRFVYKSVNKAYLYLYRRDAGSAATFRRFVCTLRSDRADYTVRRAIRRIGGLP